MPTLFWGQCLLRWSGTKYKLNKRLVSFPKHKLVEACYELIPQIDKSSRCYRRTLSTMLGIRMHLCTMGILLLIPPLVPSLSSLLCALDALVKWEVSPVDTMMRFFYKMQPHCQVNSSQQKIPRELQDAPCLHQQHRFLHAGGYFCTFWGCMNSVHRQRWAHVHLVLC